MTTNKRRKVVKLRGTRTHGLGTKKGRGAGNRGGRGMAGTGKRAGQKKPSILTTYGNSYFGKHGFKRPRSSIAIIKTINLDNLKKFSKADINLTSLGYNKLLGKGNVDRKYNIVVEKFSKKAKEKIEKAQGTLKAE